MEVEIPTEARDTFDKRVAVTIAVLAIVEALTSSISDNAANDSLLAQSRASNNWAYYQAKSMKENLYQVEGDVLRALSRNATDAAAKANTLRSFDQQTARYKEEKEEIKLRAETEEKSVIAARRVNDRCDVGSIFLQVGIVLASIGILTRWKYFWYGALGLGILGAGATASVYLF